MKYILVLFLILLNACNADQKAQSLDQPAQQASKAVLKNKQTDFQSKNIKLDIKLKEPSSLHRDNNLKKSHILKILTQSTDHKLKKDSVQSSEIKQDFNIKAGSLHRDNNLKKSHILKILTQPKKIMTITHNPSLLLSNDLQGQLQHTSNLQTKKNFMQKKQVANSNLKNIKQHKQKIDVLFYLDKRDSYCVSQFRTSAKQQKFLSHLSHLDWQISFSYHFDKQDHFLPLEYHDGRAYNSNPNALNFVNDFILSHENYSDQTRRQLFYSTLNASAFIKTTDTKDHTPDSSSYTTNPLLGLDRILTDRIHQFARKDSKKIILFFNENISYYSEEFWNKFFAKYKDVFIFFISERHKNISNISHVLDKTHQLRLITSCSVSKIITELQSR